MTPSVRTMWVGRAISVLVSLVFLMSGVMKLVGGPGLEQGMAHLGIPLRLAVPLGILEISCVAVYLTPTTAVLGSILLTGYVGGAICTHLRVGDPFYVQVALGVLVWLGLYLRESRLKDLVPIRRM